MTLLDWPTIHATGRRFILPFLVLLVGSFVLSSETASQSPPKTDYHTVLVAIRGSKFKQAEQAIDGLLDANIDDHKAHMLRKALGNALARAQRHDRAEEQFQKFLDYLVSGREQSRPLLRHLPQILVNIPYLRDNDEPRASEMLDKVIDVISQAVADEPANIGFSTGLSTAVNFKARGLQKQGKYDEVATVYSAELNRLRQKWRQSPDNPADWLRLIYLLKTAASPRHPSYQAFASRLLVERRNLLRLAVQKFPDSAEVVAEYVRDELAEIDQLRQQQPDAALATLDGLHDRFTEIYKNSSAAEALLETKLMLDKAHQNLLRQVNRSSLAGSKLPPLESIDWINGSSADLNFPQATAVAVMFVSPDHDKSMAELIKFVDCWRQHAGLFKPVVVFSDYQQSFLQLTSAKKKRGPQFEANRKLFREKLRENVIDANQLQCPIGIATNAGQVATSLGVDALPCLVVVDRNGVCRQIDSNSINLERLQLTVQGLAGQ